MRLLDAYIARHVFGGFLVVLLVIVGLDMIFALIEEMKDLRNDYDFAAAVEFIMMTGPRRLYDYTPLSSLIGCLIGLGLLASSSELTVMRAAGISTLQIITSVMKPVAAIIIATMMMGEFVVPVTEPKAQSDRQVKITGGGRLNDASRVWHRDDMVFIHINAVSSDGSIRGITRYEFNDDLALSRTSFAESGHYVSGLWELKNIQETQFPPSDAEGFEEQRLQTRVIESERWKSGLTPGLLKVVMVKPDHLSISGLSDYSSYLDEQGLAAEQYWVAFWKKSLLPFAILGLVLIAVSFIFGPLRSVTIGQRLVTGVVIGLAFKLTQDVLGPTSSVFGFAPFLAVCFPILLCFGFGFWLLRKAR